MSIKYVSLEWSFIRDKSTTMQEKLIYSEISQLSMLEKGCVASNDHFAKLLGVKKASVSRSISSLESKGYIKTKIKKGSRNHDRTITVNKLLKPKFTINKLLPTDNNLLFTPLTKCYESKETNTKDNNTVNNTVKKKKQKLDFSEIDPPKELNIKAWQSWMEFKKHKKPYTTEIGVKTAMKQLAVLSFEQQQSCIDSSIGNEYQGFFPEKFIGTNNGNQHNQKRETVGEKANRLSRELGQQAMAADDFDLSNKLRLT